MRTRGYTQRVDWLTLRCEGAEHSERTWREQVHVPLKFLLGTDRRPSDARAARRSGNVTNQ
jgi:hypothetical protein